MDDEQRPKCDIYDRHTTEKRYHHVRPRTGQGIGKQPNGVQKHRTMSAEANVDRAGD